MLWPRAADARAWWRDALRWPAGSGRLVREADRYGGMQGRAHCHGATGARDLGVRGEDGWGPYKPRTILKP
jgi:hypothetical protein